MAHPNQKTEVYLNALQIRELSNTFEVVQISTSGGVHLFHLKRGDATVVVEKPAQARMTIAWANFAGYHALGFSLTELGFPGGDVGANP